jgi:hypothetical protein
VADFTSLLYVFDFVGDGDWALVVVLLQGSEAREASRVASIDKLSVALVVAGVLVTALVR